MCGHKTMDTITIMMMEFTQQEEVRVEGRSWQYDIIKAVEA